jgi:hypothetical protein
MGRRALNVAAVLSLVLCLATLATWLVIRKRPVVRPFTWGGRQWELRVVGDRIEMTDNPQVVLDKQAYQRINLEYLADLQTLNRMNRYGGYVHARTGSPEATAFLTIQQKVADDREKVNSSSLKVHLPDRRFIRFPTLMAVALLPAVFLLIAWVHRAQTARARAMAGHCRACGYDLHGTPYCCPECGKPVSTWTT